MYFLPDGLLELEGTDGDNNDNGGSDGADIAESAECAPSSGVPDADESSNDGFSGDDDSTGIKTTGTPAERQPEDLLLSKVSLNPWAATWSPASPFASSPCIVAHAIETKAQESATMLPPLPKLSEAPPAPPSSLSPILSGVQTPPTTQPLTFQAMPISGTVETAAAAAAAATSLPPPLSPTLSGLQTPPATEDLNFKAIHLSGTASDDDDDDSSDDGSQKDVPAQRINVSSPAASYATVSTLSASPGGGQGTVGSTPRETPLWLRIDQPLPPLEDKDSFPPLKDRGCAAQSRDDHDGLPAFPVLRTNPSMEDHTEDDTEESAKNVVPLKRTSYATALGGAAESDANNASSSRGGASGKITGERGEEQLQEQLQDELLRRVVSTLVRKPLTENHVSDGGVTENHVSDGGAVGGKCPVSFRPTVSPTKAASPDVINKIASRSGKREKKKKQKKNAENNQRTPKTKARVGYEVFLDEDVDANDNGNSVGHTSSGNEEVESPHPEDRSTCGDEENSFDEQFVLDESESRSIDHCTDAEKVVQETDSDAPMSTVEARVDEKDEVDCVSSGPEFKLESPKGRPTVETRSRAGLASLSRSPISARAGRASARLFDIARVIAGTVMLLYRLALAELHLGSGCGGSSWSIVMSYILPCTFHHIVSTVESTGVPLGYEGSIVLWYVLLLAVSRPATAVSESRSLLWSCLSSGDVWKDYKDAPRNAKKACKELSSLWLERGGTGVDKKTDEVDDDVEDILKTRLASQEVAASRHLGLVRNIVLPAFCLYEVSHMSPTGLEGWAMLAGPCAKAFLGFILSALRLGVLLKPKVATVCLLQLSAMWLMALVDSRGSCANNEEAATCDSTEGLVTYVFDLSISVLWTLTGLSAIHLERIMV